MNPCKFCEGAGNCASCGGLGKVLDLDEVEPCTDCDNCGDCADCGGSGDEDDIWN